MYSRTWHGVTPIEYRDDFEKYEYETGIKDTTKIEGNLGAYLRVIEKGDYAHFFLYTLWDSLESMKRYAGDSYEIAVDYPEDKDYGLISDPIVIVQEVMSDCNNIRKLADTI